MTAKQYLNQAFKMNHRINMKLDQIRTLNDLAENCTSVITGMPSNPGRISSRVEETVARIIDQEAELHQDINRMIKLRKEIMEAIRVINDPESQTLLEMRYLCYKPWQKIADDMGITVRHVYRLHAKALRMVAVPQSCQ